MGRARGSPRRVADARRLRQRPEHLPRVPRRRDRPDRAGQRVDRVGDPDARVPDPRGRRAPSRVRAAPDRPARPAGARRRSSSRGPDRSRRAGRAARPSPSRVPGGDGGADDAGSALREVPGRARTCSRSAGTTSPSTSVETRGAHVCRRPRACARTRCERWWSAPRDGPPASTSPRLPVVGRDRPRARLDACLESATATSPTTAVRSCCLTSPPTTSRSSRGAPSSRWSSRRSRRRWSGGPAPPHGCGRSREPTSSSARSADPGAATATTTSCGSSCRRSSIGGSRRLVPELHRRAASWYAAAGRIEFAIEHALQGGDVDAAAGLVTAGFLSALYGGHADKLDRWLRGLRRRRLQAASAAGGPGCLDPPAHRRARRHRAPGEHRRGVDVQRRSG